MRSTLPSLLCWQLVSGILRPLQVHTRQGWTKALITCLEPEKLRQLNKNNAFDDNQAHEVTDNTFPTNFVYNSGLYRVVVLLWMLLGLSWLGGIIQITVDEVFNQRKGTKKIHDTSLLVKDIILIDADTQTAQNDCNLYSVSL